MTGRPGANRAPPRRECHTRAPGDLSSRPTGARWPPPTPARQRPASSANPIATSLSRIRTRPASRSRLAERSRPAWLRHARRIRRVLVSATLRAAGSIARPSADAARPKVSQLSPARQSDHAPRHPRPARARTYYEAYGRGHFRRCPPHVPSAYYRGSLTFAHPFPAVPLSRRCFISFACWGFYVAPNLRKIP
jgi:hypothetical protein